MSVRTVLLSGYDKRAHPDERRQEREIKVARKALRAFLAGRIERGSGNPTERTLLKLANVLGADLQLVEREDSVAAAG